jgi:S1-C subfamily serine protease
MKRPGKLSRAALCAPLLLACAAIGHATGGPDGAGPTLVRVGNGPANVATGFMIAHERVVTVAHVLAGGAITVQGADGVARHAEVVRRDDALDLALLAVPGLRPDPTFAGPATRMLVHRDGAVAALPARVVRRITARIRVAGATGTARRPGLELATAPAAGDSGAPVLSDGRVAGIVFARSRDRPGIAYAVDAEALARLLR